MASPHRASVGSKCSRSDIDTGSKLVRSFYSKWITVTKRPLARSQRQRPLCRSTQPCPSRIPVGSPALYVTKGLNTNTFGGLFLLNVVHNGLDRLVCLGPFLDGRLWVGADDMRAQRGGSHVRRRVARVRAWSENVDVARWRRLAPWGTV